jgi:thiosulfate dehydrogenase
LIVGVVLGYGLAWGTLRFTSSPPDQEMETAAAPWHLKSLDSDLPPGEPGEKIRLGSLLITNTAEHIGPLAPDEAKRFAGNHLTCNNCHLDGGRKIGSGSFVGVSNRFPQFRGRENKIGTLEERINGCMERSMNGRAMPDSSEEMQAMIAYMDWLSEGVPPDIDKLYSGYVSIDIPDVRADPEIGRQLYAESCEVCHQEGGTGLKATGESFSGYHYPPVAGMDTYTNGAGKTLELTAAQFIKGNMPLGAS